MLRSAHRRATPTRSLALTAVLALTLAGCSGEEEGGDTTSNGEKSSEKPESGNESESGKAGKGGEEGAGGQVVEHAFGETPVPDKIERVATVDWANQETPLALGIVPVGMSKMTWGDDDGDGVQPWVESALEELGGEEPVLFDETDGYDFEAIAKTEPDVILAGYSGLSKEDYNTLSDIAPTIAYPDDVWATEWDDATMQNARGLGKEEEGEKLVEDARREIEKAVEKHPEIKGKSVMLMTHVDLTDLSEINFYSAEDARAKFFEDLGMKTPESIKRHTEEGKYAGTISTENADELKDVDVIVTYGGTELYEALAADPVLSQLPAVKNKAVVALDGEKAEGAAANPTILSIPETTELYVEKIAEALEGKGSGVSEGKGSSSEKK
ncbi:iron complex transport system substrate-binding protein [Kytococcus aerolatus]|uniref:Iron complex transport system substrate-binding protein n=1 Tax=Kytococcus aerolatus TaxID=592308 RepID=A0A212TZU8_9MICO|nr:iron-siderophore ABC transporter substrate-binding protein [Kytococcus aerolatus]SNC71401.1 iron complex transport system substrate-binding protein [Kytococcus aerolatus]